MSDDVAFRLKTLEEALAYSESRAEENRKAALECVVRSDAFRREIAALKGEVFVAVQPAPVTP